eukprot:290547_1
MNMFIKLMSLFVLYQYCCIAETDICHLPKVIGRCRASIPRWYFDSNTGVCQSFVYGGCNGNKNNFESKEKCQIICEKIRRRRTLLSGLDDSPTTNYIDAYDIVDAKFTFYAVLCVFAINVSCLSYCFLKSK